MFVSSVAWDSSSVQSGALESGVQFLWWKSNGDSQGPLFTLLDSYNYIAYFMLSAGASIEPQISRQWILGHNELYIAKCMMLAPLN